MTRSVGYRPPRWLRNPHLQSVLSSLPPRRAAGERALRRLGAVDIGEQLRGAGPYEALFNWASAGDFNLEMGFRVDPLGAVMLALVTTIAVLVMVYSHGYMAHDKSYVRFFTLIRNNY